MVILFPMDKSFSRVARLVLHSLLMVKCLLRRNLVRNFVRAIYRFTFDANGNAVSNGTIPIDRLGGPAIFAPAGVPEPSSLVIAVVGVALVGVGFWRQRRQAK